MIDLSPQSQDKGTGAAPAAPRNDPLPLEGDKGRSRWLTPDRAEAGIQLLSRWAGPVTLVATLCLLGWWIIH